MSDIEQWRRFFISSHLETNLKKRESAFKESQKIQVLIPHKENKQKIKNLFQLLNAQFPTVLFKINVFNVRSQQRNLIRPTIFVNVEYNDFEYDIPDIISKRTRSDFPVMFLFLRQKYPNFEYSSFISSETDPYPLPKKPDGSEDFFVVQMMLGDPNDRFMRKSNKGHSTRITALDDKINRLGLVALSQWLTVVTYQPEITIPLDEDIVADPIWRRGEGVPESSSTVLLSVPESELFRPVYPLEKPFTAYPQYVPIIYVDTTLENVVRKRGERKEPIRTLHELYQERQKLSPSEISTLKERSASSLIPSSSSSTSIPSSSSEPTEVKSFASSQRFKRTVSFNRKTDSKAQRLGAKLNQFFI